LSVTKVFVVYSLLIFLFMFLPLVITYLIFWLVRDFFLLAILIVVVIFALWIYSVYRRLKVE